MAAIVQIDQPVTALTLEAGGSQAVGFDVVNIADRHLHLVATAVPAHGATVPLPDWLTLDGEQTLRLGPNETRKITVRLAPPATTAAGIIPFRLKVYEVSLPEENNGFSEPVQITVTAASPAPSPRPWRAIAAALVLLLAAGSWFAYDGFAAKLLPDVEGQTETAARAALIEAGVAAIAITIAGVFARNADGTVTKQEPAAGTPIAPDTVVTLTVPRQHEMPDLVGQERATARTALAALDLGITEGQVAIETPVRRDADGTVSAQSPAPGTPIGADVAITLEVPRLPVMPDLRGQSLDAARALLEEEDLLEPAVIDRPKVSVSDERVTAQAPDAGTTVTSGQRVAVTIPQVPRMPDVQGRLLAQALTTLEQAGIPPSVVTINEPIDSRNIGRVTKQSPDPQAAIKAGTSVALTVPRRPGTVAVPPLPDDVTGADAERIFGQQGLQVLIIEDREEPGHTPGLVLKTSPPVGSLIAENGTVRVHVLSATVAIPDLRGRVIQVAERQRLESYVVLNWESSRRRFQRYCVLHQSHDGEVQRGTPITIKYSIPLQPQDADRPCPSWLTP